MVQDIKRAIKKIQHTGQITKRGIEFTIEIENPERLEEILRISEDFEREAKGLFLETVFLVHKYLIKVTPLDTGELRGGWTSLLLKYNQDFSIEIKDKSLYNVWKDSNRSIYGREYHENPADFSKGAAQSTFEDLPLDISIINNVAQAIYMEYGTGTIPGRFFTELARYKGEYQFNKNFEEWFEEIAKNERIIKYPSQLHKSIA